MSSHGVASRMRRSSMPMSRIVSIVRWLVMWARGLSDSRLYFVTSRVGVPYVARNRAAAAPAGPEPTTRTSVCTCGCAAVVIAIPIRSSGTQESYAVGHLRADASTSSRSVDDFSACGWPPSSVGGPCHDGRAPADHPGLRRTARRCVHVTDRLSALDVSFLYMEEPTTPMHVGGLLVFEPPSDGFDYDRLVTLIE